MNLKRIILLIFFTFTAAALQGDDSTIYVERIEFRGIRNIDKYEIIRNSNARVSGKGIQINIVSLKNVLNSSIMIEQYDIDFENSMMIITVDEKYPLFMLFKVEKNISVPSLVDENRNVLDSGRFFRTDMPIIIVDNDFYENDKNGFYVKGLFDCLVQLGKENADLAGELAEVEIYTGKELRVKLKSRKTNFVIKNDLNGFKKIERSAAYLDAVNTYPEMLDLRDERILIRQ